MSNVILAFFFKIYRIRCKLTYSNTLFQDSKVEIFNEHFDREKGEGDEVNETIPPFYATLWPETAFKANVDLKSGILYFLSLYIQ